MRRLPHILVCTALAAAILVFVPVQIEQFETPKIAVVRACGLALLCWWLTGRRGRGWWPANSIERVLVLLLVVEVAATLFSVDRRLSLLGEMRQREGLVTSLALAGMYLGMREGTPQQRERWLLVVLVAGALAAVYALLQATGRDLLRWNSVSPAGAVGFLRPSSTLGHPNHLGVVMAGLVGVAASLCWDRRRDRWLTGPLAVLFALALLFSFSRGGWVGGFAAAGTLLVVHGGEIARRKRVAVLAAGGAVAGAVLVLAVTGWGPLLWERAGESLQFSTGSVRSRYEIWLAAWRIFLAEPWLGFGPDTFELVFSRYETPEYWRLEWNFVPVHAHNLVMHVLATRGMAGGLLLVALGVAALRQYRRAVQAPGVRARAWLAGLTGMFAASMFGTPTIAGVLMMLLALAELVSAGAVTAGAVGAPPRAWRRGLVVTVLVLVLGASAWQYGAARQAAIAEILRQPAPPTALVHARRGASSAPWDEHLERVHVESLLFALNRDNRPEWRDEATAAAARLVEMGPERAVNHQRLALVHLARWLGGNVDAEPAMETAFDRAARLAPVNPIFRAEHARALRAVGRAEEAGEVLGPALELFPDQGRLWGEMAEIEWALGRHGEAVAALQRAVAGRWPHNLTGWARAMQRLKEWESQVE